MTPASLFDVPAFTPAPRRLTYAEQWAELRRTSPDVWRAFQRFALEAARAGRRVGAKAVWERMRWELSVGAREPRAWRLNNNLTAYAARDFIREYPEHADLFETRKASA